MANAHSLTRIHDIRFYGVAGDLYRNGIKIIDNLFDGTRLSFAKMSPTSEVDMTTVQIPDHLFIAGGGLLKKVDSNGTVTGWGITQPIDGFTATKGTAEQTEVDDFDSAASWTGSGATLTDEGTIKQEGTNSMKMAVAWKASGTATKSITVDLTAVSTEVSSDADTVDVWFRADRPERIENIEISFALGGTTFSTDFYTRIITIAATKPARTQKGVASLNEVVDTQLQFIEAATGAELYPSEADNLAIQLGTVSVPLEKDVWVKLRIPKLAFVRSGENSALDWSDVQAVKLTVTTNGRGAVNTYWDQMALNGGAGMQGRYRYHITYFNENTGSRSNPNDTYVEVTDVKRGKVTLASLPTSSDAQVTHIEIWRTMGDGTFFFLVTQLANGTATYEDRTSDYLGLGKVDANTLQNVELQFDNIVPSSTFEYATGPHQGRMWWCNDTESGKGGHVYYSPVGRAESVKSFIDCTSSDDQTQALAIWNGSIYCFAQSGIFEILGTDEPFVPRRVFGCPGTLQPHSIIRTPLGIVYTAHDGVRIFNGNSSMILHDDPVMRIMRRETVEGIAGFVPVFGTYGRDEVYLGDTVVTLACNLPEGRWRNLGIAANAMYFEDDTGDLMAAFNDKILEFEDPAASDDDGDDIAFEIKTPTTLLDPNQVVRVGRVIVDVNPNGQQLTAYIDMDGTESTLGLISGSSRTKVELPCDVSGRVVAVRIAGSISAIVEIFHIKARMSLGGQETDKELFDPTTPYMGLWLSWGSDVMPRFGLLRAKGVNSIHTQTIRSRFGSSA